MLKDPNIRVEELRKQGFSNDQIIMTMQKEGYAPPQIIEAVNAPANSQTPNTAGLQPGSTGFQSIDELSPNPDFNVNNFQPTIETPTQEAQTDLSSAVSEEELIEAIIDEKWNELVKDINKIIEWKNNTQNKIAALEQQVADLKTQFEKVYQAIIGKVEEYDQNILNVDAELKAMEKMFTKILPAFTQNVGELSRIVKELKGENKNTKGSL